MRLVFAGTPPFAAQALEALHAAGHEIALVVTRPDRPSGRGLRPTPSAVAQVASRLRLAVAQPGSLKDAQAQSRIAQALPEVVVVAAFGLILPEAVLAIPPKGCLNIHASLLPRWRGAAPIQRAILAGDAETGVGIMVMEPGLDTGPVLLEMRIPILDTDTAGGLTDKLAGLGAQAIVEALSRLDSLVPVAQDSKKATYAAKIGRAEARLDWGRDARSLDRQVRAFNPVPGAETCFQGEPLKVWQAAPVEMSGLPGTVVGTVGGHPVVACGTGGLALTVVQRPGSRRMPVEEFLKAKPMPRGTLLGVPAT